jgi:predicted metalloprotease with PDZ domain
MPLTLRHRLTIRSPQTHLVEVETTVGAPEGLKEPFVLFMPVWTPGSYLVREYARHIEGLTCAPPARSVKIRKNAWRFEPNGSPSVTVRYAVFCNDLSVRTNHVDATHAFLNGAAVFLALEGREAAPIRLLVEPPPLWRVTTPLPVSNEPVPEGSFSFEAPDLDTLVDSPLEIGTHREERFDVLGKTHTIVVWPSDAASSADVERLVADTRSILDTEAKLFGGDLPYSDYRILLHLAPRGRGGLEHKSCAALLASSSAFGSREGYLDLLSLVAHEALHAWNVKRIRPEGLTPYRYQDENYTRLLWWFEGATSYYDWRVLRLAKLCTVAEYLEHLASEVAALDATYGRLVQSLEDASFDAWIKLYRPDENTPNSSVSYYRKGELVCAMLDLEIRGRTRGRATLDDVLRHLWEHHGVTGKPVPETGMLDLFERAAGVPLGELFDAWIRAPGELDYTSTFARVGLSLDRQPKSDGPACSIGARIRSDGTRVAVIGVIREAAAHRAGIDPGDELLAIAGRRLDGVVLDVALQGKRPGDTVEVLLARDGRTLTRELVLDPARADKVKLTMKADASDEARVEFAAWLGDEYAESRS